MPLAFFFVSNVLWIIINVEVGSKFKSMHIMIFLLLLSSGMLQHAKNQNFKNVQFYGRSQDFFGGLFFKNIQKNFQKIFKKFLKISKNFLKKIAKMHYLSIVYTQFNRAWVQFLRFWTKKAICRKFLRKFSKVFLRKLLKMH